MPSTPIMEPREFTRGLPTPHPLVNLLEDINFEHEQIIVRAIEQHRCNSLPKVPTAPTLAEVNNGIKTLSLDMRSEHTKLLRLKFVRDQQANQYKRLKLPIHIDPSTLYPTKAQLINSTKFGKSHKHKMYKTQITAPHILLPLLKSGFLSEPTIQTIRQADLRTKNLVDGWREFRDIDFRRIRVPTFDWENEDGVNRDKMRMRTAALFHYDLDLAAVQRYCGWRLTGEHRRQQQMLYWLSYILSNKAYNELWPGFVEGTPCHI
jgi:hypothetical protein